MLDSGSLLPFPVCGWACLVPVPAVLTVVTFPESFQTPLQAFAGVFEANWPFSTLMPVTGLLWMVVRPLSRRALANDEGWPRGGQHVTGQRVVGSTLVRRVSIISLVPISGRTWGSGLCSSSDSNGLALPP